MKSRLLCLIFVLAGYGAAQPNTKHLAFGQVYGSVGFLSSAVNGDMIDAPNTVLIFSAGSGRRHLQLSRDNGDYVALLEPGRYCLTALTRAGKQLRLAQNQLRCVDIHAGSDTRLDVMLRDSGQ